MASFELRSEETEDLDLGNSAGISATNVSDENARFYIDCKKHNGHWWPITGEKWIKPGETFFITKPDIGHDIVRVGARGKGNGSIIIKGQY